MDMGKGWVAGRDMNHDMEVTMASIVAKEVIFAAGGLNEG